MQVNFNHFIEYKVPSNYVCIFIKGDYTSWLLAKHQCENELIETV